MKKSLLLLFLGVGLALPGCDSAEDILSNLDAETQDRIDAMLECFPDNAERVAALLELAQAWATTEEAPAGIDTMLNGDQVEVTWNHLGSTIEMDTRFHGPDGALVTAVQLGLGSANPTDLDDLMDTAVTALAQMFPGEHPFVLARWTITGGGWSGSGTFTGIIGGSTNQNELAELRTTTDTPAGGPPPVSTAQISSTGGCGLTFQTTGLRTDDQPGQEYPLGTITFTLLSNIIDVNGSIAMPATVIATISVSGIPGTFTLNLDTLQLSGPS
jgi:hypothetical protein